MSKHLVKDIEGLFKGLMVLRKHADVVGNQRPIYTQRVLTNRQREMFKVQQLNIEQEQTPIISTVQNDVKPPQKSEILQDQKHLEVKPSEHRKYVIDPNKGNTLYQKLQEQKKAGDHDLGESTFGKSQQQTAQVDNSDVPFFMRQDRPKFSTVERYVPASAASRAMHFGMLGVQLVGGTVAEAIKQKVGISKPQVNASGVASYALNEKNANRLAMNFKKMRGGALKIGQLLSTSEESVLPPIIRDALEKARSEADIMPIKHVTKSLVNEFGNNWQNYFKEINLYPFAAASIGQVHEAILKDGMRVAMKIQYSGISNSIDSDLNNFKRIIELLGIFPRGLYLNEALDVARGELHWECDYEREAAYQRAYRDHLLKYPNDFYCPMVIDHLSTKRILTTEFIDGLEIDTFLNAPQHIRNRIGSLMIKLCFTELFEFKMMQTDPNPANYLYNKEKDVMNLLDLGAGRDFDETFLDHYMQIIWGAYTSDRDKILHHSEKIGFLTGEESKEMYNAQYQGTMIVGEPFRTPKGELYDFGQQGLSAKVSKILPTLSKHRLTPPPQEAYSLNKKIIGTYLMCIKLRAQVPAKEILQETYANWQRLYSQNFYNKVK